MIGCMQYTTCATGTNDDADVLTDKRYGVRGGWHRLGDKQQKHRQRQQHRHTYVYTHPRLHTSILGDKRASLVLQVVEKLHFAIRSLQVTDCFSFAAYRPDS